MKRWNRIAIAICTLVSVQTAHGQTQFITSGRIEFERRTNQHALCAEDKQFSEANKKFYPRFINDYCNLIFKDKLSLYVHGRESLEEQRKWFGVFEAENTIGTDLNNFTRITQKSLYSQQYLISDTVQKINWKITSEIRTIAGFDCRKAIGKIFDSVVAIAFYTDEITPRCGPESFCGLPGMILGVAVPRLHTTWYASKVEMVNVRPDDLVAPRKGKKYSATEFRIEIQEIYKKWDKDRGALMIWQALL